MGFIGQDHIIVELSEYVPQLIRGTNLNLLFRGASGFGKTHLAFSLTMAIVKYTQEKYEYLLPDKDGLVKIKSDIRLHIIDECHLISNPEFLYPLMDSKKHTFILCSNEAGELKEPLVNRCISFNFVAYTKEEMCKIIDGYLKESDVTLPKEYIELIYKNCNGIPRTAKSISQRLTMIIKNRGIPTYQELEEIIENVFQLKDGLDYRHRIYLDFLQKAKIASLDLISYATKLDKATIRREIEPVLIYKNMIQISSRGRKCI